MNICIYVYVYVHIHIYIYTHLTINIYTHFFSKKKMARDCHLLKIENDELRTVIEKLKAHTTLDVGICGEEERKIARESAVAEDSALASNVKVPSCHV